MNTRLALLALALTLSLSLIVAACAIGQAGKTGGPRAEGKAVIHHITQVNDYRQWDLWPGKPKLYPGRHPQGALLTTYVSRDAYEAIAARAGVLPPGAVVVKENYSADKVLTGVTVMLKQPGYNPAAGDWFWLKYDPEGQILAEGKVQGCISCHASVESNDWLFTTAVK